MATAGLESALWLDVEASGLGPASVPIEIGWSNLNGITEGFLIRPEPKWTDWDLGAAALHKIEQAQLLQDGISVQAAAEAVTEIAAGRPVYSDNRAHDARWLRVLYEAARWQGPQIAFLDARDLALSICRERRLGQIGWMEAEIQAQREAPPTHRAQADARYWATLTRILATGL